MGQCFRIDVVPPPAARFPRSRLPALQIAPWSFLPQHAGKEAPCEVGVVAVSITKPLDHCEHPEMQRVQRLLVEDVVGQQREAAGRYHTYEDSGLLLS